MLRPREFACSLLLQASWTQGEHFGGLIPMKMIAQCIGNRVRLGWGDWHSVIGSLAKYSALAGIPSDILPAPNDPRFLAMLPLIDQVYDNTGEDLVKGGILWADLRDLNTERSNPWFQQNVVNGKDYTRKAQSAMLIVWG